MPNGDSEIRDPIEELVKKYGNWSSLYGNLAATTLRESAVLEKRYQPPKSWLDRGLEAVTGREVPSLTRGALGVELFIPARIQEQKQRAQFLQETLPRQMELATRYDTELFFRDMYNVVPTAITLGAITSVEDALMQLGVPSAMSPAELQEARTAINKMFTELTEASGVRFGETAAGDVVTTEEEDLRLPELKVPTEVSRLPVGIHRITTQEIIKQLTAPEIPPSVMTYAEWESTMKDEGYTDAELESVNLVKSSVDEVLAARRDFVNQRESALEEFGKMPEYDIWDLLLTAAVTPGVAALDLAVTYFEHVSMPLAALMWQSFIPDIDAEFHRLQKTESTWEALSHAWEGYDQNWFLKYILMEGLVDPLSYIGFGLFGRAARTTRAIPYVGKLFHGADVAERAMLSLVEVPFDALKAGIAKIPKTLGQRAYLAQSQSVSYAKDFTTAHAGKPWHNCTIEDVRLAAEAAENAAYSLPHIEQDIVRYGKEILMHSPIDDGLTRSWASTLGSSFTPGEITRDTVAHVNEFFEFAFWKSTNKEIAFQEAAQRIMGILGVVDDAAGTAFKTTNRLIAGRAEAIRKGALAFTNAGNPADAIRMLGRTNRETFKRILKSEAAYNRTQMGRWQALLADTGTVVQRVWGDQIDRVITRTFAEAYLCFAMYGPMNVIEDYGRSILAGVRPRKMSIEAHQELAIGLLTDPELYRLGMSEMLGPVSREGAESTWNNWILQAGGLAKGPGEAGYKALVLVPGGLGMDVRRNFHGMKFLQLFDEAGGDALQSIYKAVPSLKPPMLAQKEIRELDASLHRSITTLRTDVVRNTKDQWTHQRVVKSEIKNIINEHPNVPSEARHIYIKRFEEGRLRTPVDINDASKEAHRMAMDKFIASPERAAEEFRMLADQLVALEVRNPQDVATLMQQVHVMSKVYGATPRQIQAQATIRSRGLKFEERREVINADLDKIIGFMDRAGADIDRVVAKLTTSIPAVGMSKSYISKSGRLFDIMTAKRELATQFRAENSASRRLIFEQATAKDLKSPAFWDNFYTRMDTDYKVLNKGMAKLDGTLAATIVDVDSAAGIKSIARKAIKVTDRPLAANDVAILMGCRGDDISRALLDVLTVQNDRDMFIEYVLAQVRAGDVGFTEKSIGSVYDQIIGGLRIAPEEMSWVTSMTRELEVVRGEVHGLLQAKTFSPEKKAAVDQYIDDVADSMDRLMYEVAPVAPRIPVDVPAGWEVIEFSKESITPEVRQELNRLASFLPAGTKLDIRRIMISPNLKYGGRFIKSERIMQLHPHFNSGDFFHEVGESLGMSEAAAEAFARRLHTESSRVAKVAPPAAPMSVVGYRHGAKAGQAKSGTFYFQRRGIAEGVDEREVELSFRNALKLTDDEIASYAGAPSEYLARKWLPEHKFLTPEASSEALERELVWMDRAVAKEAVNRGYDAVIYGSREIQDLTALVKAAPPAPPVVPPARTLKPEYAGLPATRQEAWDEAHKWYYKEYPDYSNANALDAFMKNIMPFWTYESSRWFWLPRSFLRHPGTFTTTMRWQDNSDFGNIHIPGTSIDVNPFRGNIYGTLITRLTRRDYPDYYDNMPGSGPFMKYLDGISRWGFYPGAAFTIPLALFGGRESQLGEILPAAWKTPLNALIAAFPDNDFVKFISETIFADRFRDFMTTKLVQNRGYDGPLIWSKLEAKQELTDEEQSVWDAARGEAARYGVLFEQTALFRLRPEEQNKMAEAAAKVIELETGYTPEEQTWLERHGYRVWDMVGGISLSTQMILQEMDYYKWTGATKPLLPGHQQDILIRLELDWDDVSRYVEGNRAQLLEIEEQFKAGVLAPRERDNRRSDILAGQRAYIDRKMEENPAMTLDGRKEYAEENEVIFPVQHITEELQHLFWEVELTDRVNPETMEIERDWDTYYATKKLISNAVPDQFKEEWDTWLSKNLTELDRIEQDVNEKYFRVYWNVWRGVLDTYPDNEQRLIKEYLSLTRLGTQIDRREAIRDLDSVKTGNRLISSFQTEVSNARTALRYANPYLDAWLYYFQVGGITSFKTPEAELVYKQISKDTGRII